MLLFYFFISIFVLLFEFFLNGNLIEFFGEVYCEIFNLCDFVCLSVCDNLSYRYLKCVRIKVYQTRGKKLTRKNFVEILKWYFNVNQHKHSVMFYHNYFTNFFINSVCVSVCVWVLYMMDLLSVTMQLFKYVYFML